MITKNKLRLSGRPDAAACGELLRRDTQHFGMGPAVVLGQDLGEVAGPVRDRTVADLAAGDRRMGDGHGEAAGS